MRFKAGGAALAAGAAVAVAVVFAGGGGERQLAGGDARRVVLQPADLGAGYAQFDDRAEAAELADDASLGGRDGWVTRYRPISVSADEPAVVESRVELFANGAHATRALRARERDWRANKARVRRLDSGPLRAAVSMVEQPRTPQSLRVIAVSWRTANAVAAVSLFGRKRLALREALALARRQQDRLVGDALGRGAATP